MALPDIFSPEISEATIARIERLNPEMKPLWGTMDAGQMLAHCNVTYGYVFEPDKYKPTPAFVKILLKILVKKAVVGEKPYKKGSATAPDFKISGSRDFEAEKHKLISNIRKTAAHGRAWFEGKESHSFGPLNAEEWNNMFYKHLDHHLRQFGV